MSLVARQHTCACCGGEIHDGDPVIFEPLIDGPIRYVATHAKHPTFAHHALDSGNGLTQTRAQDTSVSN